MSFCAFPSARRPVRRRPPLAINFTDLVKIEEHTDKMISSLKQSNHATTPLHTTDIIASEYMYPSSTTPIRSEHLSINSSRDSVLSINDIPSLGFQSQDDLDTPLSSLASSPSAHHYPLTSLGNADLPLQIAGKSATEQLRQWKSSAKQHQGAQPQGSSSRKGIGSVSSHKNAKSDISAKLSKSLPPLPPQLNSRHLLHSDDSRESVAQKIASIGGKASRDNSRSRSTEQPHEARRAVSAEERSKGLDTALPPLKVKTSQKALPTAPLKLVPLSRPELLQDNKLNLQSRTSSSHSDVLFSFQDLQSSGQASSDSLVLPLAHIKQPMRPQNLSQPSTGLHAITAMTSKPIICENPFVNKASDAGQRAARVNPKVKAIVPSIPATNPMVDDRENPFPNVFLTQKRHRAGAVYDMQSRRQRTSVEVLVVLFKDMH
ncbi:hypothetical protein MMC11_006550 [Xylographa trunciseda]|nr:hypothetical protein [Xylographa trunciseda]